MIDKVNMPVDTPCIALPLHDTDCDSDPERISFTFGDKQNCHIDFICEESSWNDFIHLHNSMIQNILSYLLMTTNHLRSTQDYFITVILSDDSHIHDLNREWRQVDKPTNVLSFSQYETHDLWQKTYPDEMPIELGDVFIAWDYCQQESKALGLPFAEHFMHILIHGILHILGYDHINLQDAQIMEQLEGDILQYFGFARPYEQV